MNTQDTDTMIKLLDKALSSNNESVKELLQSLLVSVSLIHADDKVKSGPLTDIVNSMHDMQATIANMQRKITMLEHRLQELASKSDYTIKKPRIGGWADDITWNDTHEPTRKILKGFLNLDNF